MRITFYGAAKSVTGSRHLLELDSGKRILLDCGLFQGMGPETEDLNIHFGFEPHTVDALILSHAHIDHSGNIPYLVKQGFAGNIYCTLATLDLCTIMLMDSAYIHMQDIKYINKKRTRQGRPHLKPLYTTHDVDVALKRFKPVEINKWKSLFNDFDFMLTDAGHILGSAALNMRISEKGAVKKLFFSGDIGRECDIILRAPQPFPQCDYLICESTYGDSEHEDAPTAKNSLEKIIIDTCVNQKGKLIIPAFALGRTQEIVYAIDRLVNEKKIPMLNVYVDSPLACSATEIMRRHTDYFNPEILEYMVYDADPFGFSKLKYIRDTKESKALNLSDEPCIIIAASGMTDAGRIKHHIKNNVSDAINTILIVGYLPAESLGGKLLKGHKEIRIFGETVPVRARINKIDAYSAHADYVEMLHYLRCQDANLIKSVFLVHGEPEVQINWMKHLNDAGFKKVFIPEKGESFEL